MEREKIYLLFFLALITFFFLTALLILLPFAVPILWAIVVGIVLYPVHKFFKGFLRSDTLSALATSLLVLLFMIVPLSVVSVLLLEQMIDLTQKVLLYLQAHSYQELIDGLRNHPALKGYLERLSPVFDFIQREESRKILADSLNQILRFLGDKLGQIAFSAGKNIFYIFVFLLTFFFILRDGPKILRRLERLIPMKEEDLESVFSTIYKTVLAVVYGSVGTAGLQALIGLVGYTIVGVKFSLIWSALTFFAAFIPPFGASAVWFPLAVYVFFEEGIGKALFLGLWGFLLISSVDNFIRPLIIKQGVHIPYVVLFFATIGGLLKFGFIGLFLGPIIFTTLFSLFKIYEKRILRTDT